MNDLKTQLHERIADYKQEFGVICFLYSILLTKVYTHLYNEINLK